MPGEFDLIQRFFVTPGTDPDLVLGIGDDAAVLQVPSSLQLVVTTDTLNSGVHFPVDTSAADIAFKTVAVNVSDLAAMGATPKWATLNLSLPSADENWLAEFSASLHSQLEGFGMQLVGGDTTRGPLSLTLTAFGVASSTQLLRRDAARVDDIIAVTGTLGDAKLGLDIALQRRDIANPDHRRYLLQRLNRPSARLAHSEVLRGHARAAIDISDGLAQDLSHVLQRSHCGAVIDVDKLPLSSALRFYLNEQQSFQYALAGGDDYELLFTVSVQEWPALQAKLYGQGLMATAIGRITAEHDLQLRVDGKCAHFLREGFQHF